MAVSRRTALKILAGAGVGAVAGGATYQQLAGNSLRLTELTLPVAGLPEGLDGLRIGLLTDVHRSRWVSHEDVARAVARLNQAAPDLIALGGDYVTNRDPDYVEPAVEALANLKAAHGVFAVLGNHDDERDVPRALARRGIQCLNDARTRLAIGSDALELSGIRFWTTRTDAVARAVRGSNGPVILLAHDPRRLPEAAAAGVSVVLSGHTHGGQIVLPGFGAIAARRFPTVAGLAQRGDTTLFVSRGLGTVYVPVRINCPPEVHVITLRSAALPATA